VVKRTRPDFLAILKVLAARKVDFIVVGGVSAVLQGAPIATFDLDIVHSREPANIERLLGALQELEAYDRGQGARRIEPGPSHLASAGHQLLLTAHGPLDLLGTIGAGRDYEALLGGAEELVVGPVRVRVLGLPALIETKVEAGREKDRAVLSILRRTLEERRRK
jgi:predicted nucleotidyltransferase